MLHKQEQDPFIRQVYCTLQFEAMHHWPDAPDHVYFLREHHRHIFYVMCIANVAHNNRDIEFITMKHDIEAYCSNLYDKQRIGCTSCEMIAEDILERFPYLHSVTVSEDNENGAIVTRR